MKALTDHRILTAISRTDLKRARKDARSTNASLTGYGSFLITDTKEGVLDLRYFADLKRYKAVMFHGGKDVTLFLTAAEMTEFLVSVYKMGE